MRARQLLVGMCGQLLAVPLAAQEPPALPAAPPEEVAPDGEAPEVERPALEEPRAAPAVERVSAPEADAAEQAMAEPAEEESSDVAPSADSEVVVDTSGEGLFGEGLSSGGDELPAGDAAGPVARGYELNGYVRGDMFVGKVPGFRTGTIKAGYGELALKLRTTRQAYGDAFVESRVLYGLIDAEQRVSIDLREAYVNAYLGPIDLRLGQQIIVWGRADAFNPTNNLTPVDLRVRSPVEDDRRQGNVSLRGFINVAPLRLEGVWLPIYRASELPHVTVPEFVVLGDTDYPKPEIAKGTMAGRLHLELPDFEASVSYLHGYAPLPGLALSSYTVGTDPPEIRISRTAYEHDVLGVDISTALGEFLGVRAEAAYRLPADYEERVYAPRPDVQYVLGLDRGFGPVSVIAQYVGRYVLDWQRDHGPEDPLDPEILADLEPPLTSLQREFVETPINQELSARNQMLFSQTAEVQHLVSLRLEWLALHETLSLSALGLVNLTTEEWLLYPNVSYKLTDAMSAAIGAEVYAGPPDTLLGLIDEELSAGYAELRSNF